MRIFMGSLGNSDFDLQPTLREVLADNNVGDLQQYFRTRSNDEFMRGDITVLLGELIHLPSEFKEKDKILNAIIDYGFDFTEFFYSRDIAPVFEMYAKNPAQDTVLCSAMFAAEALRAHYLRESKPYDIPYAALLASGSSLKDSDALRKNKESILMTQNALVEFVAEMGPKLPINRGAAFLNMMASEIESSFWTQKIQSIDAKSKYHLKGGDYIQYTPHFN